MNTPTARAFRAADLPLIRYTAEQQAAIDRALAEIAADPEAYIVRTSEFADLDGRDNLTLAMFEKSAYPLMSQRTVRRDNGTALGDCEFEYIPVVIDGQMLYVDSESMDEGTTYGLLYIMRLTIKRGQPHDGEWMHLLVGGKRRIDRAQIDRALAALGDDDES